jgi:hypothetical protein
MTAVARTKPMVFLMVVDVDLTIMDRDQNEKERTRHCQ